MYDESADLLGDTPTQEEMADPKVTVRVEMEERCTF